MLECSVLHCEDKMLRRPNATLDNGTKRHILGLRGHSTSKCRILGWRGSG